MIVIDEAQDLDRETFEVEIEPMGASTDATYVFIGTPWSVESIFYDKVQAAKKKGLHLEFNWEAVASTSQAYAKFIAKKIEDLGRDSVAFLTQYALQWVAAVGKFFDPNLFETYARRDRQWITAPVPGREYVAGIDVAGDDPNNTGRTDWTVLTFLEVDRSEVRSAEDRPKTCLVGYAAWRGKGWEEQFRDAVALLTFWGPTITAIDSTGMGDPWSARIEQAGFRVERLKYTEESKSELGHLANAEITAGRSTYAAVAETDDAKAQLAELKKQALALLRENRKRKRIAFFVPEDKGHDDVIMSWFNAIKAANIHIAQPEFYEEEILW
ncbi:Terminase-like family protein [compost metagenome]